MELYAGMDLHSRNTLVGVIDSSFKRVFEKRVPNDLSLIVDELEPFSSELVLAGGWFDGCRLQQRSPG